MKQLLLLVLALSAPLAHASNTSCTDASGTVQYTHRGYNAGMPPRDGDVIGTIQIKIRGKLVSESIAYKNREPKLGSINPDFTEQKVLHQESGRSGSVKDFSAKLTLSKNGEASPFEMTSSYYVICQEIFLAIP